MNMIKIPGNYKGNSVAFCPLCQRQQYNMEHYFHCTKLKLLRAACGADESDITSSSVKYLKNVSLFFEGVEEIVEPVIKL